MFCSVSVSYFFGCLSQHYMGREGCLSKSFIYRHDENWNFVLLELWRHNAKTFDSWSKHLKLLNLKKYFLCSTLGSSHFTSNILLRTLFKNNFNLCSDQDHENITDVTNISHIAHGTAICCYPDDSAIWDSHITRQLGYNHIFCQNFAGGELLIFL